MRKIQFKKKHMLYLVELLIILVLVLGGFWNRSEYIFQVKTDEIQWELSEQSGENVWRSEALSLTPGVYRMLVEADIPSESSLTFSLDNQSPRIFREILSNDLTMQNGQPQLSVGMTVTAKAANVCLQAVGNGNVSDIELKSVTLERTGQMYYVLAVCFLILVTIVNLLVYLHRGIREKRITGEQQLVVWALPAIILVAVFPDLTDYITVGGETMQYLIRTEAFVQGNPTAVLGRNWFLVVPAFFRIVGFTVQSSWQLFVWGVNIITALFAYHCLWRCIGNRKVALSGTVIYMLNPWRTYCFYNQGDIEGWLVMSFLPLLICVGLLMIWKIVTRTGRSDGLPGSKMNEKNCGEKRWVFLVIVALGVACYQMNDLAFHLMPTYLYYMNVWNWESLIQVTEVTGGLTMAGVVSLCSIVILAMLAGYKIKRRGKTYE